MPTSKLLAVQTAISDLLEGINPTITDPATAAPYAYDLRGKVFRGRVDFGEETVPPFVSIIEPPLQEDGLGAGLFESTRNDPWKLLLHGFAPSTPQVTDGAYALKAVVEQRLSRIIAINTGNGEPLFATDYLLGRLITGLTVHAGAVRGPTQGVSSWAFFYLPLSVSLVANPANPYAD